MRSLLVYGALVLCLGLITVASLVAPGRYRVVVPALDARVDAGSGKSRWGTSGTGVRARGPGAKVLELTASEPGSRAFAWRSMPLDASRATFDHVRVAMHLRVQGLAGERGKWQPAQVTLLSFDGQSRRMWFWPYWIARLEGSSGWQTHSRIVPLHPDTRSVLLSLTVDRGPGTLLVRGVTLQGLAETTWSRLMHRVLVGGWIAAWLWACAMLLARRRRSLARALAVALGTALTLAGTAPQPHLRDTIVQVTRTAQDGWYTTRVVGAHIANTFGEDREARGAGERRGDPSLDASATAKPGSRGTPRAKADGDRPRDAAAGDVTRAKKAPRAVPRRPVYWVPRGNHLDKAAHFGAFALFALIAGLAYRPYPLSVRAGALALFAASIQAMQSLSVTRDPDLVDFTFDVSGIAAGLLAAAVLTAARGDPRAAAGARQRGLS